MAVINGFHTVEKRSLPKKDNNYLLDSLGIGQQLHGSLRVGTREGGYAILGRNDLVNDAVAFILYNNEGNIVGILQGDVATARYLRWSSVALGDTRFYEDAVNLTSEIARVSVDDGLLMATGKPITVQGTGAVSNIGG